MNLKDQGRDPINGFECPKRFETTVDMDRIASADVRIVRNHP
jgi:hypothetical protein